MDSFHFIENENIHEITVGINTKTDIRYTVGRQYTCGTESKITVTAIEFDQNALVIYGISRALIFGEKNNGEEILWKVIENIPMSITCKV
jgi:hypothetical protein